MKVYCTALLSGKYLPNRFMHTAIPSGQSHSIPFSWGEIPQGTKSFAISFVEEVAGGSGNVHWLVVNLPASTRRMQEGASGIRSKTPVGAVEIRNSFGNTGYTGPRPLAGTGSHCYLLTVYALNAPELRIGPLSTFMEFLNEVKGNILETATLMTYFTH
jgi:Raf kinase inhibitor-like YbhB/YbcL family protein